MHTHYGVEAGWGLWGDQYGGRVKYKKRTSHFVRYITYLPFELLSKYSTYPLVRFRLFLNLDNQYTNQELDKYKSIVKANNLTKIR